MKNFLKKWNFEETTYYKVIDDIVFRNVAAGLIEETDFRKTSRKVDKYRIVAQHFNCNLPYTKYYLIFDDKIYETEQHPTWVPNILNDMAKELKELIEGENS